jgi:hypothetical protein
MFVTVKLAWCEKWWRGLWLCSCLFWYILHCIEIKTISKKTKWRAWDCDTLTAQGRDCHSMGEWENDERQVANASSLEESNLFSLWFWKWPFNNWLCLVLFLRKYALLEMIPEHSIPAMRSGLGQEMNVSCVLVLEYAQFKRNCPLWTWTNYNLATYKVWDW